MKKTLIFSHQDSYCVSKRLRNLRDQLMIVSDTYDDNGARIKINGKFLGAEQLAPVIQNIKKRRHLFFGRVVVAVNGSAFFSGMDDDRNIVADLSALLPSTAVVGFFGDVTLSPTPAEIHHSYERRSNAVSRLLPESLTPHYRMVQRVNAGFDHSGSSMVVYCKDGERLLCAGREGKFGSKIPLDLTDEEHRNYLAAVTAAVVKRNNAANRRR